MHFHYFNVIFPSKKDLPFNLINLISLHPRMHCANFVWNWQRGSGEYYWTSSKNFYYFAIIFILKWVRFFNWIICFSAFTFVGLSSVLIKRKCEKFTGKNDKDRQPTNFYQKSSQVFSSGELKRCMVHLLCSSQNLNKHHITIMIYTWK